VICGEVLASNCVFADKATWYELPDGSGMEVVSERNRLLDLFFDPTPIQVLFLTWPSGRLSDTLLPGGSQERYPGAESIQASVMHSVMAVDLDYRHELLSAHTLVTGRV
jgi:hypothetical protein